MLSCLKRDIKQNYLPTKEKQKLLLPIHTIALSQTNQCHYIKIFEFFMHNHTLWLKKMIVVGI